MSRRVLTYLVFAAAFLLCFGLTTVAAASAARRPESRRSDIDTRSRLVADYSVDASSWRFPLLLAGITHAASLDEALLQRSPPRTGRSAPATSRIAVVYRPRETETQAGGRPPEAPLPPSPSPSPTQKPPSPTATPRDGPLPSPTAVSTPSPAPPPEATPDPAPTPPDPAPPQPTATPIAPPTATPTPAFVPPTFAPAPSTPTAPRPPATATPLPSMTPTPTRTPTAVFTTATPTPVGPVATPTPPATGTPTPPPTSTPTETPTIVPTATPTATAVPTSTPAPTATATPSVTPPTPSPTPTPTATPSPTPSPTATPSPTPSQDLLLHKTTVGGANKKMSHYPDGPPGHLVVVNDAATEVFQSVSLVDSASGLSDWTLTLVQKDRPIAAATVQVDVWAEDGGCTSYTSVATTRRFATASVSLPAAVPGSGVSRTVTGTGAAPYAFAASDRLCLSIFNGSGGLINFYVDTDASSGATGQSRLGGPYQLIADLLVLHKDKVAGSGSQLAMSRLHSGADGDNLDLVDGTTTVFQSESALTNASGASSWRLTLVLKDKPLLATSLAVRVWAEAGTCTSHTAVPAASRFADALAVVPIALDRLGTAFDIAGTGSAAFTFGTSDLLCLSLQNLGVASPETVSLYTDTDSNLGVTGQSSLRGPFN